MWECLYSIDGLCNLNLATNLLRLLNNIDSNSNGQNLMSFHKFEQGMMKINKDKKLEDS